MWCLWPINVVRTKRVMCAHVRMICMHFWTQSIGLMAFLAGLWVCRWMGITLVRIHLICFQLKWQIEYFKLSFESVYIHVYHVHVHTHVSVRCTHVIRTCNVQLKWSCARLVCESATTLWVCVSCPGRGKIIWSWSAPIVIITNSVART